VHKLYKITCQHPGVDDCMQLTVLLMIAVLVTTTGCAVHELRKKGVTIVTGCGSQAQLDRVMARLAALQGSVVDGFHLWPPAKRDTSGAVQVTVL